MQQQLEHDISKQPEMNPQTEVRDHQSSNQTKQLRADHNPITIYQYTEVASEEPYYIQQDNGQQIDEPIEVYEDEGQLTEIIKIEVEIKDEGQNFKIEMDTYDSELSQKGIIIQDQQPYLIANPTENAIKFRERLERMFMQMRELKSNYIKSLACAPPTSKQVTINRFWSPKHENFIWEEEQYIYQREEQTVEYLRKEMKTKNNQILLLKKQNQILQSRVAKLQEECKFQRIYIETQMKQNQKKHIATPSNIWVVRPEQYQLTDRPEKPITNPSSPEKINLENNKQLGNPCETPPLAAKQPQEQLHELLRIHQLIYQDLNTASQQIKKKVEPQVEVFQKIISQLDRQVRVIQIIIQQVFGSPNIDHKIQQENIVKLFDENLTSLGQLTKDISEPVVESIAHNIKFVKTSNKDISNSQNTYNQAFKKLNLSKLHNKIQSIKIQHDLLQHQPLRSQI